MNSKTPGKNSYIPGKLDSNERIDEREELFKGEINRFDVLFQANSHKLVEEIEGNRHFLRFVSEHSSFYSKTSNEYRYKVADIIVNTVKLQTPPGRFFEGQHTLNTGEKPAENILRPLSDDEAIARTLAYMDDGLNSIATIQSPDKTANAQSNSPQEAEDLLCPADQSYLNVHEWEKDMKALEDDRT